MRLQHRNEASLSVRVSCDSHSHVTFWLIIVVILAAAFRFALLGSKSLWLDEASTFWIAGSNFASIRDDLTSPQLNDSVYALYMGLYYALLHFWTRFGQSEFWLRLPSALFGVATVPLLYALGSRLFGKRTGLAAAFLLAVQPVQVAYSQEARSYALCMFLSVAACYFFVRGVQEGLARWWLLYVLSSVLAIYSHLFAVFLLPAQALAFVCADVKKVRVRSAIVSAILIVLLIAPVFRLAMLKDRGRIPWGIIPGPRDVLHALQNLTGAGLKFPVYCAVLGIAAVGFYRAWRDPAQSDQRWRHVLLWGWFLLPVAFVVLVAFWKPPLFPRYFAVSLPASALLAAVALSRLRSATRITAATIALGTLFIPAIFSYYRKPKEDWRGAAAYLLASALPEDGIVFYQVYGQQPYDYYRQRAAHASVVPVVEGPSVLSPGQAADFYRMPTMWLVVYGVHSNDSAEALWLEKTKASLGAGRELVSRQRFPEIEILCYTSETARMSMTGQ